MNRKLRVKAAVIVAIILICIYGIIGLPKSKAELAANWKKNIHLGLDLSGGTQLVMQVHLQDAFKAVADNTIDRLKLETQKQNIEFASMDRNDPNTLEEADKIQVDVKGVPATKAGAFRAIVNEQFPEWVLTSAATDYRLNYRPTEALKLKRDTMTQTMATIERKINGLGLAESSVQPTGRSDAEAELLVQLPGVDDSAHIKQLLQTQAVLEWTEVKDGPFQSQEEARTKHGGVLPLNTRLVPSVPRGGGPQIWYLVSRSPIVRGTDIRTATASQDQSQGRWETNFVLTQEAAKRFERYTEANIGNRAAIVVDNQVISAPTIESRISDTGRITGAQTTEEASDLALNLRAGSLPAGIGYQYERTVGPSLGADSIREGFWAGIVGLIAVVLAMLLYYKRSGINATLALILNAVILIAALSYFNATLTLPGIAGIILTIGMAVDSNVLIFERIREELRAGKAVAAAVDAGFSKAFLTIIDTHVTTVVSCAFLFIFGTGPVKGFAVTLVIGLIANVFTAVFVSKTIFDFELSGKKQLTALSI